MNDHRRARLTRWLNESSPFLPEFARTWILEGVVGHRLSPMQLPGRDLRFVLDLSDAMESNLYLDRSWEPATSNWAAFFASRAQVMADVGGHIGYFTVLMGRYGAPGSALHAFEPDPRGLERMKQNTALNELNVTLNQIAVSDQDGTGEFSLPRSLRLGTGRLGSLIYARGAMRVQTTRLDSYCERNGLARIDLVKMDIEGGEVEALQGMTAGLRAGRYGVLLIELHQHLLPPVQVNQVLDQLSSAGYRLYEVHADRCAVVNWARTAPVKVATPYICALSPADFQALGAPEREFCLPAEPGPVFAEALGAR